MTTDGQSPTGDLIHRAAREGRVDLLDLTDEDQAVIGQGNWVLSSSPTHQSWTALREQQRWTGGSRARGDGP